MIEPRERVPYEDVSGLSYCIAPPEQPLDPQDPSTTIHHGNWGHKPGKSRLKATDLNQAIVLSRTQLTRRIDHNADYREDPRTATRQLSFHPTFTYSKFPRSEVGGVRLMLFGATGAVTSSVLDFRHGVIRPITDEERTRLFSSGELGMQSVELVRAELTRFTVARGMDHLNRGEINAYKDAHWADNRRGLIEEALERFLPIAFEPIEGRYAEALERGLLPPTAPATAAEAAGRFVHGEPTRFAMFNRVFNEVILEPAA